MRISRRGFLQSTAVAGAAALPASQATGAEGDRIPTRVLGKTGARVSILAMGGGSRFLMYDDEQSQEAVRKALDLGITYIDTSDDYGNDHLSERRLGRALKGRRNGLFLATKLSNRDGSQSRKIVEQSLKALELDQVDLIHIHSLTDQDDLAKIEAKGGVLDQLLRMKQEKLTRFIGITSHTDPAVLKNALERHDFDCTQMALNGARTGMKGGEHGMIPNPDVATSFESLALPVAKRKHMGVIAMKVFAQDALLSNISAGKLLYYSLSLPVTTAVVGMPKLAHIEENVELAKAFQPLSRSEMKDLSGRLSQQRKAELDRFFSAHRDA